ncbi:hypothetical protein PACTADRAFT_50008 [Pachysolen tannophilus NRRL Y-2460]|uniref:Zinc/iron permease n=1 Tax=Pachysolen tannophilus NRRL Y-2460 TaxID=669874 RepID=A0A1E4TU40_PACTA|nr:hypothetical protein PACTADRAFT_50008 [Pachysolen tannophilus NRRL Y-2460]
MYIVENINVISKNSDSNKIKYTGINDSIDSFNDNDFEFRLDSAAAAADDTTSDLERNNINNFHSILKICLTIRDLAMVSPASLGLLIHSLCDGVALTSSVLAANKSLSVVVFIAIFVHKVPTAFSLTSVLLNENISRRLIKMQLIVFSFSLAVGSIGSFIVFSSWTATSDKDDDMNSVEYFTAALLLYSGGTFLYVGVHTMLEILGEGDNGRDNQEDIVPQRARSSGSEETVVVDGSGGINSVVAANSTIPTGRNNNRHHGHHHHAAEVQKLSLSEFGLSLLGMVLPVLIGLVKE